MAATITFICCVILQIVTADLPTAYYDGDNRGYTEVPSDIPSVTLYLHLAKNNLQSFDLYNMALAGMRNIIELYLGNNQFVSYPNLCPLNGTLTLLDLSANEITIVPTEQIQCLGVLKILKLQRNKISVFPDISPLGNTLGELHMSHNPITEVKSNALNNLTKLLFLDIESCYLTSEMVDKMNFSSSSLQSLNIRINNFNHTPDFLKSSIKTTLFSLDMTRNSLGVIPKGLMAGFQKLQWFKCSKCDLTTFPGYLTAIITLEVLVLADNDIHEVPDDLGNLVNLRVFEIGFKTLGQKWTSFPNFGPTNVGATLESLVMYKSINVHDRVLEGPLTKLNSLTIVNSDLYDGFPRFGVMPVLTRLNLAQNGFKNIPCDAFKNLTSLEILSLEGNKFTSIPDLRVHLPNLKELYLPFHHLICDCQAKWLKRWAAEKYYDFNSACHSPFNNRIFGDIQEEELLCEDQGYTNFTTFVPRKNIQYYAQESLSTQYFGMVDDIEICMLKCIAMPGCQSFGIAASTGNGQHCEFLMSKCTFKSPDMENVRKGNTFEEMFHFASIQTQQVRSLIGGIEIR